MSRFYPPDGRVPDRHQTDQYQLEPLTVAHVHIDYAAVMLSQKMLRTWSGSDWPEDGFTVEDNRVDLERHQREHENREAFTYTVLSPDRQTCLGCVYMYPNSVDALEPRDDDVLVSFWVAAPLLFSGLDAALLEGLREWLAGEFAFGRVFFYANEADTHQLALLGATGLVERTRVALPPRRGLYLFFEDTAEGR